MSVEAIEAVIARDIPEELLIAVVSAALYASDLDWAQEICIQLSTHQHFNVRGNAIMGFGHLARIHGHLDHSRVLPIIEAGLHDPDEYVRSHSHDAASDVRHFLNWTVSLPN